MVALLRKLSLLYKSRKQGRVAQGIDPFFVVPPHEKRGPINASGFKGID
jgi:hypothetical protein